MDWAGPKVAGVHLRWIRCVLTFHPVLSAAFAFLELGHLKISDVGCCKRVLRVLLWGCDTQILLVQRSKITQQMANQCKYQRKLLKSKPRCIVHVLVSLVSIGTRFISLFVIPSPACNEPFRNAWAAILI